jgi:hypothetical protein
MVFIQNDSRGNANASLSDPIGALEKEIKGK